MNQPAPYKASIIFIIISAAMLMNTPKTGKNKIANADHPHAKATASIELKTLGNAAGNKRSILACSGPMDNIIIRSIAPMAIEKSIVNAPSIKAKIEILNQGDLPC
jgi:hypothetical protein